MMHSSGMFYLLSTFIVVFSLAVIMLSNPIFSALFLALSMISMAFVFFVLDAHFIAGVQLMVYAGAVMVLFVMVLMLFDLGKETEVFSKGKFTGLLKIACAGWLCGLIGGAVYMSTEMIDVEAQVTDSVSFTTKALATELFTNYVFAFEALGVLLLLVAIGVVAVSRMKGGTHAR